MNKALALSLVAGLGLSACESSDSNTSGIQSLGQFFTKAFRQDANDEPLLLDGQSIPSYPEKEPFDV